MDPMTTDLCSPVDGSCFVVSPATAFGPGTPALSAPGLGLFGLGLLGSGLVALRRTPR
ncbi:MAG: hypothetical protein R3E53_03910 [Myxococcota bacterium]